MRRQSTELRVVVTSVVAPLLTAVALALAVSVAPTAGLAAGGDPVVGSWATYQWMSSLKEDVPVLVKQDQPGGQASWSVVTESVVPIPLFVTYSILSGDAKSYVLQIVTRQKIDSAPLSVTQITVDRATGQALKSVIQRPKGQIVTPESGLRPFRQATVKGTPEEVAVPAGRFQAVRASYQNGMVWVSDQVPAMGLAKAQLANGQLELLKSGSSGARDLLRS
jgi:hypothetical protein